MWRTRSSERGRLRGTKQLSKQSYSFDNLLDRSPLSQILRISIFSSFTSSGCQNWLHSEFWDPEDVKDEKFCKANCFKIVIAFHSAWKSWPSSGPITSFFTSDISSFTSAGCQIWLRSEFGHPEDVKDEKFRKANCFKIVIALDFAQKSRAS